MRNQRYKRDIGLYKTRVAKKHTVSEDAVTRLSIKPIEIETLLISLVEWVENQTQEAQQFRLRCQGKVPSPLTGT